MYVEIFDSGKEYKEFIERNDWQIKVFNVLKFKDEIILTFEMVVSGAERPLRIPDLSEGIEEVEGYPYAWCATYSIDRLPYNLLIYTSSDDSEIARQKAVSAIREKHKNEKSGSFSLVEIKFLEKGTSQ